MHVHAAQEHAHTHHHHRPGSARLAVPPASLLRLSLGARLLGAGALIALVWAAVWGVLA